MTQGLLLRSRVFTIDMIRGLVMIIMALDHVRDFFHKADAIGSGLVTSPTDLATTTPILFFTRWITHFCAPSFVFLAGTSAFLSGQNKSKKELSIFLLKRGLWLVLAEIIIITFSWSFNPLYNTLFLQVIWAIGVSMIILSLLIHLPLRVIFILGFVIVFGHNILDYPSINSMVKGGFLSDLLYFSKFSSYSIGHDHFVMIIYPFVPWSGLMMLGYCFGQLYSQEVNAKWRKRALIWLGSGVIVFFVIMRFMNLYGDPVAWSTQPRGPIFTFLSFLNLNKYPPSLLFLCMTIGPVMIFLALLEKTQNSFTRTLNMFGRVPMFYYILHFFLIHFLVVIVFYISGFNQEDIKSPGALFLFRPADFGFPLWGVYMMWLLVLVILYPLCRRYNDYKNSHKKWWLSYL
jgi:uncharacterized membrane protein